MFTVWLAGMMATSWRGEIYFPPPLGPSRQLRRKCNPSLKDYRERLREESNKEKQEAYRAPEIRREEQAESSCNAKA